MDMTDRHKAGRQARMRMRGSQPEEAIGSLPTGCVYMGDKNLLVACRLTGSLHPSTHYYHHQPDQSQLNIRNWKVQEQKQ